MSHDSWSISLFVRLLFVCVLLYIPRRVSCYPPRWIGLMWRHRCNLITIYTECPKKTLYLSDYFYIFIDPCGIFSSTSLLPYSSFIRLVLGFSKCGQPFCIFKIDKDITKFVQISIYLINWNCLNIQYLR